MSNQFTQFPDLASRALGGNVCTANDELFAQRELPRGHAPASGRVSRRRAVPAAAVRRTRCGLRRRHLSALVGCTARQPSIPHSPPCTTVTAIADTVKAVAQAERTNNE